MSKHTTTTSKTPKTTDPAGECFPIFVYCLFQFNLNLRKLIFEFLVLDNIVRLLESYDAPLPPPSVPIEPLLVKKMSISELKRNVLRQMQTDFKKLDELSRKFHMDVQELSSLDGTYKEMLYVLHENKSRQERREVRCGSLLSSKSCKGGVFVNINVSVCIVSVERRKLCTLKCLIVSSIPQYVSDALS